MTNKQNSATHQSVEKLTYTAEEACAALNIGRTTLWRLEQRGLIHAIPDIRHKLYSIEMLRRFVNGGKAA